jgi:hypothetical protein
VRPNPSYMDSPHKRKRLINSLAFGEIPAVVYPASKVDSVVVRADMESASLMCQLLKRSTYVSQPPPKRRALGGWIRNFLEGAR